jgi:hypothetical protein
MTLILISENSSFSQKKTTRKLPHFNKNLLDFLLLLSKNLLVSSWFCKFEFGNPDRMRFNKVLNSNRKLIIRYTHETRLATYNKHIHQLWNQIFTDTPVVNTKLIVGNRNSRNATKILIHQITIITYNCS